MAVISVKYGQLDMQSGAAPGATSGIVVVDTDVYNSPKKLVDAKRRARANGAGQGSAWYDSKTFTCQGNLKAPDIATFETLLDTFKQALDLEKQTFDIDFGGGTRRYIATSQNLTISRPKGLNQAGFTVEFICPDPFGHDTTMACPVNSLRNMLVGTIPTSFESGTLWATYNQAALSIDSTVHYYGKSSLKIVTSGVGTDSAVQGARTPATTAVIGGQTYTFSFWVKGTAGDIVRCYSTSPSAADAYTQYTLTGNWQRVSHTMTHGTSGTVNLYAMIVQANTAVRTAYVDGMQYELGSNATEFTESASTTTPMRLPFTALGNYAADAIVQLRLNSLTGGTGKTLTVTNPSDRTSISTTANFALASALDFNAAGQRASLTDTDLDMTGAVTVAAWINADTNTGTILNKRYPSGLFRSYTLEYNGTNVRFIVTTVSGLSASAQDTLTRPLTTWTHYVGTYDGQYVRLYVNGVLVASTPMTGQLAVDSGQPLYLGSFDTSAAPFDGRIKKVRIWNRAVSDREVGYLFYANYAGRNHYSGLMLEYLMNGGTGTTLTDSSGRGNNGTITGATWVSAPSVVVFDGVHKRVSVNGVAADYLGVFPVLQPGEAALEVSHTLTTLTYSALVAYDKRFL